MNSNQQKQINSKKLLKNKKENNSMPLELLVDIFKASTYPNNFLDHFTKKYSQM